MRHGLAAVQLREAFLDFGEKHEFLDGIVESCILRQPINGLSNPIASGSRSVRAGGVASLRRSTPGASPRTSTSLGAA
jgi:hypothetical protein